MVGDATFLFVSIWAREEKRFVVTLSVQLPGRKFWGSLRRHDRLNTTVLDTHLGDEYSDEYRTEVQL